MEKAAEEVERREKVEREDITTVVTKIWKEEEKIDTASSPMSNHIDRDTPSRQESEPRSADTRQGLYTSP